MEAERLWPEADWKRVQPFPFAAARGAFAGPTADRNRIAMDYYLRPKDSALVAVVTFGALAEGAPGLVHGGMTMTVLDEALGAACWLTGRPSLTVQMSTDFRRGVPLGARLLVETHVTNERHRLISVSGTLRGPEGALYACADGRFLHLDAASQRRIFGRAVSPKTAKKS